MNWARLSIGAASTAVVVSALLAALTIWLLMTDPVMLTAALGHGTAGPIVRALTDALLDVVRLLLRYL
jgi:hypothetical protein